MNRNNIAVIGAGTVGLSTAINIQNALPGSKVKVLAEKFYEDTTSYGSAGICVPDYKAGYCPEKLRQWWVTSAEYYRGLVTGPEAGECGGIIMPGYYLAKTEIPDPLYKETAFDYRKLSDEELQKLNFPSKYNGPEAVDDTFYKLHFFQTVSHIKTDILHGYHATTFVLDQSKYLKWLRKRFEANGGEIEVGKITSLRELVGRYDVVANCTGYESRFLVNDPEVYPIRGYVIRVRAPWIKQWVYTDDMTHIFPNEDTAVLGGFAHDRRQDMDVIPAETKDILQRCEKLVPSIKSAEIVRDWVALRPGRDPLRLERETITSARGKLEVVHNYGHGMHGIALSWGTSIEAAQMLVQALNDIDVHSRL